MTGASSIVDLRSDTVTKPTTTMRQAMAEAEVGDDVYGEDPTVNRLEQRAAVILGKPAALFVPTGCMGNAIGVRLHSQQGDEVVCDHRAHVLDWELGVHSWFSGCLLRAIPTQNGILRWRDIEPVIRPRGTIDSPTAAINLENTHNMGGGTLYPIEEIDVICDRAHERGIKVHMDGARIFNAAVASGVSAARIASKPDTVMFCLFVERAGSAGGIDAGGNRGSHRARTHSPQEFRGRDAPGGSSGGGRTDRAGRDAGAASRGSRQCSLARGRLGRAAGRDDRSSECGDQHRYIRRCGAG